MHTYINVIKTSSHLGNGEFFVCLFLLSTLLERRPFLWNECARAGRAAGARYRSFSLFLLFFICNNLNNLGIFNLRKCITLKSEHHSSLKFSISFLKIVLY